MSVAGYVGRSAAAILMAAARCYQWLVRPLMAGSCRYVPGCSEYFIEAVRQHGPWQGTVLGVKRVLRCRPGGGWGYDPVPPVTPARRPSASTDKGTRPMRTGTAE